MFNTFQSWALQNYGDSGKTKTVTLAKYARIAKILSGEETATSENSKFRFWVKAKGFKLGRDGSTQILYIPSKSTVSTIFLINISVQDFIHQVPHLSLCRLLFFPFYQPTFAYLPIFYTCSPSSFLPLFLPLSLSLSVLSPSQTIICTFCFSFVFSSQ